MKRIFVLSLLLAQGAWGQGCHEKMAHPFDQAFNSNEVREAIYPNTRLGTLPRNGSTHSHWKLNVGDQLQRVAGRLALADQHQAHYRSLFFESSPEHRAAGKALGAEWCRNSGYASERFRQSLETGKCLFLIGGGVTLGMWVPSWDLVGLGMALWGFTAGSHLEEQKRKMAASPDALAVANLKVHEQITRQPEENAWAVTGLDLPNGYWEVVMKDGVIEKKQFVVSIVRHFDLYTWVDPQLRPQSRIVYYESRLTGAPAPLAQPLDQ